MITSTFSARKIWVYAILKGLPTPSLSKHLGKPDYASIKDTHQLMMSNAELLESALGRGKNGYLVLGVPPVQYTQLTIVAFEHPPKPGSTATVPECTPMGEEKRILHEPTEARQKYNEYHVLDTDLKNQLIVVFDDAYLSPIKSSYRGCATKKIFQLLEHLYKTFPAYLLQVWRQTTRASGQHTIQKNPS